MIKGKNGYALLVSVVVIATVMLIIATVSARRVQDGFFVAIDLNHHMQAQVLAEGCVETAILRLVQNPNYIGGEVVSIGNSSCTIVSASGNIIKTEAVSENRYYRLEVSLSSLNPATISGWQRVDSF